MKIGPFETLAELGRGGMGVVYHARSPEGADVAIKVLSKADGESLARFERERRLLGTVTAREGFVPLLDSGVSPLGPYLVMPLVAGGTLRKRLERGPLGVPETLALGRALAAALGRAHERGIVHRDLKPENVIFDTHRGAGPGADRPLLADLGLAKHFDMEASGAAQSVLLSSAGDLRGTVGYMAPEQGRDSMSAGPPADVFALGAILYECLAGRGAFTGSTILEVLEKVDAGDRPSLRAAAPSVPAWLAAVVEKALSKSPEARYQDGRALRRALAVGEGRGRRLLLVALLSSVLVFVVAGLLVATRPPAPGPAPPPVERPKPPPPDEGRVTALIEGSFVKRPSDLPGAIRDLDTAIKLDPGRVDAWLYRAELRVYTTGDLEGGLEDANKVIALDPRRAGAHRIRARVKLTRKDLDGALADLDKAVELDPGDMSHRSERAQVRLAKGDLDGAIADLERCLARCLEAPLNSNVTRPFREQLGELRAQRPGARPSAEERLRAKSYMETGTAKRRARDYEGAIADMTRSIELDPGYPEVWGSRGAVKAMLGDQAGAIADFDKAIELEPGDGELIANRGFARDRSGDRVGAIADFERFLQRAPPRDKLVASVRARLAELRRPR